MTTIPPIGFGLWKVDKDICAQTVYDAAVAGYRHFDSACDYGNEEHVGQGFSNVLKDGVCARDDLWVTSKLWNTYHRPEHVRSACERSLKDLGLDVLDLYLIHFPIPLKFVSFETRYPPEWLYDPDAAAPQMIPDPVPRADTWGAMEGLVEAGLVKHIGVCNYNSALLSDLMAYARIKPSVLQIESHPYLTQEKLIRLAQGYGLDVTAFSPLGALSYVSIGGADMGDSVLSQDSVVEIANRMGKTPAQVVLRWGIQRGTAIIPKTINRERMAENLAITEFSLSDDDMRTISALNQNRRFNDPGVFCEGQFGTLYPIFD